MYVSFFLFLIGLFIDKILYLYFKYDTELYFYYIPLYLISYIIVAYPMLILTYHCIRKGDIFNEKVLMCLSSLAAIFIREYEEATAIILFYTIGEYFQEISILKSKDNIKSLLDLKEKKVLKLENDKISKVLADEIKIGDKLLIKPGEKILFDSVITKGESDFDLSIFNGETKSKSFSKNDKIYAGMINLSRNIEIKVIKNFEQSSIYKLIELIENAGEKKSKTEKLITKFSKYYTPLVFLVAIYTLIIPSLFFSRIDFVDSIYSAIAILVVSCPCSLVLSIPLSFFTAIGKAAKNGILIKDSNVFDNILKAKVLMLDKTGTITNGKFKVIKEEKYEQFDDYLLDIYVYNVQRKSNHPISKALCENIKHKYEEILKIEDIKIEEIHGKGIIAKIDNKEIKIGNKKLLNIQKEENDLATYIYVSLNDVLIKRYIIKDTIKDNMFNILSNIRKNGIEKIIMLTGDNEKIANDISRKLSIDKTYSNLMPEDKLKILTEYEKFDKVIFIGDGLNDAPIISRADVSIAMGEIGQDITIEKADIVLNNDNIESLIKLKKIAKKIHIIVLENLIIILAIKFIVIIFGLFNFLSMWVAVFADVGLTILAILNALRIKIV